jgi:hypothetical protein
MTNINKGRRLAETLLGNKEQYKEAVFNRRIKEDKRFAAVQCW